MRPQVWIFLLPYALSYGFTVAIAIIFQPTSLANLLGLLSLLGQWDCPISGRTASLSVQRRLTTAPINQGWLLGC